MFGLSTIMYLWNFLLFVQQCLLPIPCIYNLFTCPPLSFSPDDVFPFPAAPLVSAAPPGETTVAPCPLIFPPTGKKSFPPFFPPFSPSLPPGDEFAVFASLWEIFPACVLPVPAALPLPWGEQVSGASGAGLPFLDNTDNQSTSPAFQSRCDK